VDILGVSFSIRNKPSLDPDYRPLHLFNQAFLKTAGKPVAIAVENSAGLVSVCRTRIHGTPGRAEADAYFMDRLVKTLLWQKGGYKLMVCGDRRTYEMIAAAYRPGGARAFDADYMQRFFERPFEAVCLEYGQCPVERCASRPVGRHLDGCRIGFDAGGSDRKVSAVIDGEPVFGEEVVWLPKENANPDYHFKGIVDAFKTAASHMPSVDGIGVSSAGVYVGNRTMAASLFLKVPQDLFEAKVKDIYIRAAREIGPDIPVEVCNDGDVSALAGAMSLGSGCVLGLAMGTSEAGGYVDKDGCITGWLNELAFVPVDANPDAMADEWSGDIGCGVKYFSQDGVIKLSIRAGIDLSAVSTPADKLKTVQQLMAADDPRAVQVYQDIGCYLGHALAWYDSLYEIKHVLLLGRVMSGKGGDLVLSRAKEILADEYPDIRLTPSLPDEKYRRIGQSVAAASLPDIQKSR
jgi:predicted NBD/HSP70 family sugar kinase